MMSGGARYDKYKEADPNNRYQKDYSNLLSRRRCCATGSLGPPAPRFSCPIVENLHVERGAPERGPAEQFNRPRGFDRDVPRIIRAHRQYHSSPKPVVEVQRKSEWEQRKVVQYRLRGFRWTLGQKKAIHGKSRFSTKQERN